jgi:SAM-dependent methyltransferase
MDPQAQGLIDYYSARAPEFDRMYLDHPAAYLREVEALAREVEEFARGRSVLELACGTGHWTQFAARTARAVLATDASEPMLERARARGLPANVQIHGADAFAPPAGDFDAVLAVFWLSHVPRARLRSFLGGLPRGAALFFADNLYVPGEGGELVPGPGPDSWKRRKLQDASEYLIVKNYFTADELRELLPGAQVRQGDWLWRAVVPAEL